MKTTRPNGQARVDIHAIITNQIIAAIEAGAGQFKMPWHRSQGSLMRPMNIATGNAYQGINILSLWVAAEARGYSAPIWGTFKQWLDAGYPVRKGEKSVMGVVYKDWHVTEENAETGESVEKKVGMARAFPLFNCAQVEGYAVPDTSFTPSVFDPHPRVESLLAASSASIAYGGERAFYDHLADRYDPSSGEAACRRCAGHRYADRSDCRTCSCGRGGQWPGSAGGPPPAQLHAPSLPRPSCG